jgi:hypothetical protein
MPPDPASQLNRLACQAAFTYSMTVKEIKIVDTGKGAKAVDDDLEGVLRKIENWHQGSIAGYRISFTDARGACLRFFRSISLSARTCLLMGRL